MEIKPQTTTAAESQLISVKEIVNGSEKQIKWANDIRNSLIATYQKKTAERFENTDFKFMGLAGKLSVELASKDITSDLAKIFGTSDKAETIKRHNDYVLRRLGNITNAKWMIENRNSIEAMKIGCWICELEEQVNKQEVAA